jgi:hypothetical protein
MPKFTIEDLMIGTAIFAVGLMGILLALSPNIVVDESYLLLAQFPLYIIGWGVAGAGILYPIKLWQFGYGLASLAGIVSLVFW